MKNFDGNLDVLKGAKWICGDKTAESPIITKRFNINSFSAAAIYITGLGYFDAKINGQSITDERLLPIASDYEKRDYSTFYHKTEGDFTNRIYYHKFDITKLLKNGENTLTIQLGNGWYRQRERTCETNALFGESLKTIFCIEIQNENGYNYIRSDGTETWHNSNVLYNNLFVGEIIDNRFSDDVPKSVTVLEDTASLLTLSTGVSDKVIREIKPTLIKKENGISIFDCKENITGVVSLTATGNAGEKITLRFAENIDSQMNLDFTSTGYHYGITSGGQQTQTDTFILAEGENYFEPKFVWHGFRYFEVLGEFDDVTVKVIHSDTPVISKFESDSEGLNFLYEAFIRSQLGNMHGSFPSDCPHRERLGYTGDGQVASRAAMLTLDAKKFYYKWIQDILDCQDSVSGHVRHTAPYMGGGGGPVGWGGAIVFVPYNYYKTYGEKDIIIKTLPHVNRWLDYIKTRIENGLVAYEAEGGWFLGDWSALDETKIPPDFVNTCLLMNALLKCEEMAKIIGSDYDTYRELYDICQNAVIEKFFDGKSYCGGIQGADAFAIYAGITYGNPQTALKEQYENLDHFDTGFIGTDILLHVLFENDFTDIAYNLLNSDARGTFLYMKRKGATTIWENWAKGEWDGFSHNHPMFGGCARQIFESVLGIKQIYADGGFNDIVISPKIPTKMNYAVGSIKTANGEIYVEWRKENDGIHFTVNTPKDCTATLIYNNNQILLKNGENTFTF